jgi:hypothetical protein
MKKVLSSILAVLIAMGVYAQEELTNYGKLEVLEEDGKTTVNVGGDLVVFEEGKDTTKIKLGNKGVTIIEDEDGTSSVEWEDLKDMAESDDDGDDDSPKKNKKFKPHWAGLEIGVNGFVNSDFSTNVSPSWMDLNTGRSWNINLNFIEHGFALGTDKIGLVTGLGLEWSNYHFDGSSVIREDAGAIVEYSYADPERAIEKARLQTTYLTAPLLLEFQIPAGKKRVHFSGGVIGGVKLGSNTKVKYIENGDKQKDKIKDDFNLNSLRYGFTARIGYRSLKFYANYYPTSLFESGKGTGGDKLYPFAIGLRF